MPSKSSNDEADAIRAMMSGYLDGELDDADRRAFEERLESDPELRRELGEMRQLVSAASDINVPDPPEDVWDSFLDDVYNRLERRVGWLFIIVGMVALTTWAVYLFVVIPWASALTKILCAVPVVGLTVLFLSVLRERMFIAKTDRYSREVKR